MEDHRDLVDFIDTDSVQFVNPYEINPIVAANLSPIMVADDPLQQIIFQEDIKPTLFGGTSLAESADVKVKMEEFSDLSSLVRPLTDELTTPVFEKDAFNFTSYVSRKPNKNNDIYNIKVESNNTYSECEKSIFGNLLAEVENQVSMLENNSDKMTITLGDQANDINLYQVFAQKTSNLAGSAGSRSIETDLSSNETASRQTYNNFTHNAYQFTDDLYSEISSSTENRTQLGLVTPEDSNSSEDVKQKLTLNIGDPCQKSNNDMTIKAASLNTPDIIEGVVDLTSDNFNILDLVNNEDLQALDVEDDLLSSLSSPQEPPSTPSTTSSILFKQTGPVKRSRRRKSSYEDEDDEDYIPPSKRRSMIRLQDIDVEGNSSDSDSDSDTVTKQKSSKMRGRRRKRNSSVFSDVTKDGDGTKYRELRDKNNEASRKSRLKRKMRELEYEKEADELHIKNIKLKAQVEELEKMVSTFRNNLFQILIKK